MYRVTLWLRFCLPGGNFTCRAGGPMSARTVIAPDNNLLRQGPCFTSYCVVGHQHHICEPGLIFLLPVLPAGLEQPADG